ncbi:MAG: histidine--tRNA ligase [Bacilli bacterium]|nr:histidine--tRNA ligase [Bacilli bacterium]
MITKPKGCHDLVGLEAKKWKYVDKVIDSLMEKYNYTYARTPIFESSELFHRGVGETTDIVTKETYDFKDRGDRSITLRPEGTAGIVRSYVENKMYGEPGPVKVYYNGTMYRYERPQSGRDREFTQFGVEVLGSNDPLVDAEVISIPVLLYKMLGLKGIKVKINSLGDRDSRDNYREALIKYFTPHIKDLCEDCNDRLNKNPLRILDCKVDKDSEILKNAPTTIEYLNEESKNRFEEVKSYLEELEIDYEVDPRLVRGLDYYNHTVFEIEASVEGFGSNNVIGAGGRYNGLVETLDGPETCCMGFATGLGRLVQALDLEEVKLPIIDDIELFVMYVSDTEKKYAASLVQYLRANGYRVDTEYTGRGLKAQFKQADRLNAKYLIILNDEDLAKDEIKIKNNKTKEEETISVDYLLYFLDEHLSEEEYDYDFDDEDECHCGCGHHHDDECTCGDECHCHHEGEDE